MKPVKTSNSHSAGFYFFLIATLVFLIGSAVYFFDRPQGSTFFIPADFYFEENVFGNLGNHMPSFAHVFTFILLSAIFVKRRIFSYLLVTFFWLMLDSLFEIAQHKMVTDWLDHLPPPWLKKLSPIETALWHFHVSTFDYYDLIFVFLGAVCALATLILFLYIRD